MLHYCYRTLSGQNSHFLIGSSQTESLLFLYFYMYLFIYFTFRQLHPVSSLFPYPHTPPKFLVSLTTTLLAFASRFISILKPYPAISHPSSLIPLLVFTQLLHSNLSSLPSGHSLNPSLFPLYPLSPLSTLSSEAILPLFQSTILHPPLALLLPFPPDDEES